MILALKLMAIAWLVVHFEPFQDLLLKIYQKVDQKSPYIAIIDGVHTILSCFKCASFHFVLLGTFNIWYAITAAVIATIYQKLIG